MYGEEEETLQGVAGKIERRKDTTKGVAIILE
jgi:hypothetical protein